MTLLRVPVDPVPNSHGGEASILVFVVLGDASLPFAAVISPSRSSSSNSSSESRMTRIVAHETQVAVG
jgi:hypothetical protein